jgi:hypothetical protein
MGRLLLVGAACCLLCSSARAEWIKREVDRPLWTRADGDLSTGNATREFYFTVDNDYAYDIIGDRTEPFEVLYGDELIGDSSEFIGSLLINLDTGVREEFWNYGSSSRLYRAFSVPGRYVMEIAPPVLTEHDLRFGPVVEPFSATVTNLRLVREFWVVPEPSGLGLSLSAGLVAVLVIASRRYQSRATL